jgi:hypothetical protein
MADCDLVGDSEETPTTLCDGDRTNNVWIDGGDPAVGNGACMLDTMREDQVVYVLQRDERAREDLKRVTTNERLLELANTVPSLPKDWPGDAIQDELNPPRQVLLYTNFKGQPPWNQ